MLIQDVKKVFFLYRHTEQHHICHMYICASDHETECKNKFIFIWLQSITKSNMLQQKKKQERETRGEKTKTNNRKILCHIINPLNGISLYCAVFFFHATLGFTSHFSFTAICLFIKRLYLHSARLSVILIQPNVI